MWNNLDGADLSDFLDEDARHAWFFQQPLICQGCLNLDWYYTQRCILGKTPERGMICSWLRVPPIESEDDHER